MPLFEDNTPDFQPVELDQGTQKAIDDLYAQATQTPEQAPITDILERAQQNYGGLLSQPGQSRAITQKYGQLMGEDLKLLSDQKNLDQKLKRFERLGLSYDSLMKKNQINMANYEGLLKAYQNKKAARAQMLGSLLKLGGVAAGAAAGGPVGASVGAAGASAVAPNPQFQQASTGDIGTLKTNPIPRMQNLNYRYHPSFVDFEE